MPLIFSSGWGGVEISSRHHSTYIKEPMKYTEDTWPTDQWPNFSFKEIACQHTGECDIDPDFMDKVQKLRILVDEPLVITSGYRSPDHPIEAKKSTVGAHAQGKAIDVQCMGSKAHKILAAAMALGFSGIGVSQSGDYKTRFLHLDTVDSDIRPGVWSY